jgi:hypothetical protein
MWVGGGCTVLEGVWGEIICHGNKKGVKTAKQLHKRWKRNGEGGVQPKRTRGKK